MPKKVWFLLLTLLLCAIAYIVYDEWNRSRKRKENLGLVKGEVVSVNMDIMNGQSAQITYRTTIGHKEINGIKKITSDQCSDMRVFLTLVNRQLEVAYEKDHIENCDLLISRKEYQEYNITPSREVIPLLDALAVGCGDHE